MAARSHWERWHDGYDDPASSLSARLAAVRGRVAQALSAAEPGPITLISACAGQGRDVIPVVRDHPRRDDVRARLVERDPALVSDARRAADTAGLHELEVVVGDAAVTSAYDGVVPANVALFCGVFGNITEDDMRRTVDLLPTLLAAGGWVIWTRHTRAPDSTVAVRRWFADAGFAEVAFDRAPGRSFGVGTHRLVGPPRPAGPPTQLFSFVGDGSAASDPV